MQFYCLSKCKKNILKISLRLTNILKNVNKHLKSAEFVWKYQIREKKTSNKLWFSGIKKSFVKISLNTLVCTKKLV